MKKQILLSLLFTVTLTLVGCGQKGPLIIEEPTIQTPKTQTEELDPTR